MTRGTEPPAVRRGRPRDERARTAILQAAASLLDQRGYDGATMEGIATAAGVGKQTVYRWWSSKESLIGEAFLEGFVDFPDVPLPRSPNVWADLAAWLSVGEDGFRGNHGELLRVAVVVSSHNEVLAARMIERFSAPARARLLDRLHRAVEAGHIAEAADLGAIADLIEALITHAGLRRASSAMVTNAIAVLRAAVEP